mmetsp:Transcript_52231/g.145755  ORF Transcript_52231/g.145755 Transcript_52231/m.145755 type:complete len:138 (+) Transcript_52231:86-499(+)
MARRGSHALCAGLLLLGAWVCSPGFVGGRARVAQQDVQTSLAALRGEGGLQRDPLPKGYGIRTGLSDLLKPLNSEYGVTAKEDSIPTYITMFLGIVLLFLFYFLLLLINNQSVLLPPEDEFDEYVANFLPYFFFGEK